MLTVRDSGGAGILFVHAADRALFEEPTMHISIQYCVQ